MYKNREVNRQIKIYKKLKLSHRSKLAKHTQETMNLCIQIL